MKKIQSPPPFFICFLALTALAVSISSVSADAVANPTETGPITVTDEPGASSHNYVFFKPEEDLAQFGYVEKEFFIEGVANRYKTPSRQTGRIISSGHSYKIRIVVRKPVDVKKF